MNIVEKWFGDGFSQLHPDLQKIHQNGGHLRGIADVAYGVGLAGWIGQRIARKVGVPKGAANVLLEVSIESKGEYLLWRRMVAGHKKAQSHFRPYGNWPDGYWIESSSAVELQLRVQTNDGAWRWQQIRFSLFGITIPQWMTPKVVAYKRVESGQYRFEVALSLPLLGFVFSYGGLLDVVTV